MIFILVCTHQPRRTAQTQLIPNDITISTESVNPDSRFEKAASTIDYSMQGKDTTLSGLAQAMGTYITDSLQKDNAIETVEDLLTHNKSILYKACIRGHGREEQCFEMLFTLKDFRRRLIDRDKVSDLSEGLNVEAALVGDCEQLARTVKYIMHVVHTKKLQKLDLSLWHCMLCGGPGRVMENEIMTAFRERPQPCMRDIVVILCEKPECDRALKLITRKISAHLGDGVRKALCHLASCGATGPLLACARCRMVEYCCKEHQVEDWKTHKFSCAYENAKKGLFAEISKSSSGSYA